MSESGIRADIYDAVRGVPQIGNVHDYDRFTADWTAFKNRYKATIGGVDLIRGWDISLENMFPSQPMEFRKTGRYIRTYQYVIRGYLGLKDSDESEKTAAGLAEDVCDAIDSDSDLCDSSKYYQDPNTLAKIRTFLALVFGDVLCHYIEIEVVVMEFVS